MAKIVSLNKFRKARARVEETRQAKENRARYGRDKAEKSRDDIARSRHESDVESRRLDTGDDSDQSD